METIETTVSSEVVELLTDISTGVNLQVHLIYLLLVIICVYGLYRLYTRIFGRFF